MRTKYFISVLSRITVAIAICLLVASCKRDSDNALITNGLDSEKSSELPKNSNRFGGKIILSNELSRKFNTNQFIVSVDDATDETAARMASINTIKLSPSNSEPIIAMRDQELLLSWNPKEMSPNLFSPRSYPKSVSLFRHATLVSGANATFVYRPATCGTDIIDCSINTSYRVTILVLGNKFFARVGQDGQFVITKPETVFTRLSVFHPQLGVHTKTLTQQEKVSGYVTIPIDR